MVCALAILLTIHLVGDIPTASQLVGERIGQDGEFLLESDRAITSLILNSDSPPHGHRWEIARRIYRHGGDLISIRINRDPDQVVDFEGAFHPRSPISFQRHTWSGWGVGDRVFTSSWLWNQEGQTNETLRLTAAVDQYVVDIEETTRLGRNADNKERSSSDSRREDLEGLARTICARIYGFAFADLTAVPLDIRSVNHLDLKRGVLRGIYRGERVQIPIGTSMPWTVNSVRQDSTVLYFNTSGDLVVSRWQAPVFFDR